MTPFATAAFGYLLGLVLATVLYIALSCASLPELIVVEDFAKDAGSDVDPCDACWEDCGKTDAQIPTIFCAERCNEICAGTP